MTGVGGEEPEAKGTLTYLGLTQGRGLGAGGRQAPESLLIEHVPVALGIAFTCQESPETQCAEVLC